MANQTTQEKYLIVYDDNEIYFTDKASYLRGVMLPRDTKEMEFDSEEEMKKALNSELFEDYFEE